MFTSLPEELIVEILQWLPLKGLATSMQLNKQLYRICKDDRLWIGHQDFPYRSKSEFCPDKSKSVGSWLAAKINSVGEKLPPARLCHTGVVHDNYMYINGGHTTVSNTQLFNNVKCDTWRFNFVTKKWEEIVEPKFPTKTEHSAVVSENCMWLYGGFAGTHFTSDITCYDLVSKQLVPIEPKGDVPSPRSAHVAVAYGGKMWVFGGWNGSEQNNDLFSFDFVTHEWARIVSKGPNPLPRCSHCATVSPAEKSFFVFGGCGGRMQNYLADLWQFNFETMTWTDVGRLQPGSRMKMAEYRSKLYIYGGWNSVDHFNSFNEFDIHRRKWRKLDPEFNGNDGKMGQFSMCIYNHKMYQFAGYSDGVQTSTNDLHAFRMGKPEYTEGAMSAH